MTIIARSTRPAILVILVCVAGLQLSAQTVLKLPKNTFTPQQDVELGRKGAAEVRKQYPIIQDERIATYLNELGERLVNPGMFDAAAAEGEVVGVMAHELAHVLLRHGTANVTKSQNPWLQIGQMAGAIGGGIVGGAAGSAIAQGSQLGLGAIVLRYSRDFEKQADLLGAQIMARAGYDPRGLARMFETIEKESKGSGGGGTPQWLSSHPNPGNRTQ
jgi:predicted Zn-dependent protease